MAVGATAIWRVRPNGVNTNGGGYDPGIGGAATDYSQQNAAQATGTNGSGSATTTFTDATAANFTSAMVGNAINISGQGTYFVITFTSATQVVVDRALGTFSGASWSLGGGWADPFTNVTSSGPLVPGNIVYILGSGTPNPSSYTYDYTYSAAAFTSASGNATTGGKIIYANDPSTPGAKTFPDLTGGMPVIKLSTSYTTANTDIGFTGIWFVHAANSLTVVANTTFGTFKGCVMDQFGFGGDFVESGNSSIMGCEVFSSVAGGPNGNSVIGASGSNFWIAGCNIHDCTTGGISAGNLDTIVDSVIAKCGGDGIGPVNSPFLLAKNLTIDGNTGHGINFTSGQPRGATIVNCIISNHTGAGKFGITVGTGTTAQNDRVKVLIDFNTFYNNTANYNAISAGAHDTALGTNPYAAQAMENYTLA